MQVPETLWLISSSTSARQYAANYRRLAELIDEVTLLHMRLLKGTPVRRPQGPTSLSRPP
jgi:hypothetical protein